MSRGSPCFLDMVHTDLVTNNYGKLARVPRLHEGRASVRGPERSTRPAVEVATLFGSALFKCCFDQAVGFINRQEDRVLICEAKRRKVHQVVVLIRQ